MVHPAAAEALSRRDPPRCELDTGDMKAVRDRRASMSDLQKKNSGHPDSEYTARVNCPIPSRYDAN
jgi:hypothetical protein